MTADQARSIPVEAGGYRSAMATYSVVSSVVFASNDLSERHRRTRSPRRLACVVAVFLRSSHLTERLALRTGARPCDRASQPMGVCHLAPSRIVTYVTPASGHKERPEPEGSGLVSRDPCEHRAWRSHRTIRATHRTTAIFSPCSRGCRWTCVHRSRSGEPMRRAHRTIREWVE